MSDEALFWAIIGGVFANLTTLALGATIRKIKAYVSGAAFESIHSPASSPAPHENNAPAQFSVAAAIAATIFLIALLIFQITYPLVSGN